jgi:hypothetical protein
LYIDGAIACCGLIISFSGAVRCAILEKSPYA